MNRELTIVEALHILKKYFGYPSFKSGQESIIGSILQERDSFAIMPTGAGKSICYQVPALMLKGVTIVISPLISLMQDQVKSLNEAGIHAAYINSSLSDAQISKALQYAGQGLYKIIYVAPERLESREFMRFATNTEISMITVDEAHCISQWGQDFRPSYLKIVEFIRELPKRPIISAFTATATEEVKEDIMCTLGLQNPNVVVTGFDRENLYYSVEHARKKDDFIIDYVSKHPHDSGIIYCATRKNVDKVYELLLQYGVSATKYHAGLETEERKQNQDDFIYDRMPVVVATNAFGMGIDKSNVRYVIHYNMPQSMENYYQEAGRAGRDGEPSQCILLFSAQDVVIERYLLGQKDFSDVNSEDVELIQQRDMKRLHSMEDYCTTTECLRNYILEYFGEKTGASCDNCGNCHREYQEIDMTAEAKWVINCIYETKGRYGIGVVDGTLRGMNQAKLREIGATDYKSYGVLHNCDRERLRLLINQMLHEEYLHKSEDSYGVLSMGPNVKRLHDDNTRVIVRVYEEKEATPKRKKSTKTSGSDYLTKAGFELFEKLRILRLEIAKEEAVPPYIIFNDKTLVDMCVKLPHSKADMLNVSGVGEAKIMKFGQQFLDEIKRFEDTHPDTIISEWNRESEGIAIKGRKEKKVKKGKKEFYITPKQANEFQYSNMYTISEIRDMLNEVRDTSVIKKVHATMLWEILVNEGLTIEDNINGVYVKTMTDKGLQAGIETEHRVSQNGYPYEVLMYPESIQKLLVDYFTKEISELDEEYSGEEMYYSLAKAGAAWSDEEDARLIKEYNSGIKISDIAEMHKRTRGAIRARLKKMGLID